VLASYFSGLVLGLALITPIGAQNLFVLEQGLRRRLRGALPAVAAAAACDTLLILLGAGGAAALLAGSPRLERTLIAVGVAFLVVLGLRSLRSRPEAADAVPGTRRGLLAGAVAVSLLNPHAVIDTVGVIGGAIAAQDDRLPFAAGAVSASWLWFLGLASIASVLRTRLSPRGRLWIARGSGALMLAFAALLARQL
jgi:L-lysine exporter family protein LysE/ArgO